ncbi:hypothetical protein [Kitasatospora brasiliensis]|uniref:hypothetical protein n=1 Tax=Kitasatospora brasiliensis TaxID=3058040 RepID=UPI00292F636F|nr:hypothetical protein [Kitasatospora sp. K002]
MSAAVHTVRLTPVAGPGTEPGVRWAAALFEARVSSLPGTLHGLLAAEPTAGAGPAGPGFEDEHLALDLTRTPPKRWRHQADVLHAGRLPAGGVLARLREVLAAHPGCAVATAEHRTGVLVLGRSGAPLVLWPAGASGGPLPPLALGSLAHAWLAFGRRLAELSRVDVLGRVDGLSRVDVLGRHSPELPRACFRAPGRRQGGPR